MADQAPLSKEFSRNEYWSELPFPSTRDLLQPGIKPGSPVLQGDFSPPNHQESPDILTSEHVFHFGPGASSFLELLVIALHSSLITYWTPSIQPDRLIFQCRVFLPFHTVHRVCTARILEWFAISSSKGSRFVKTLH